MSKVRFCANILECRYPCCNKECMILTLDREDEEARVVYLKKDPNEDNTFNLISAADNDRDNSEN